MSNWLRKLGIWLSIVRSNSQLKKTFIKRYGVVAGKYKYSAELVAQKEGNYCAVIRELQNALLRATDQDLKDLLVKEIELYKQKNDIVTMIHNLIHNQG